MDLREKKTKRSIQNAFLQIRSKKPLEKITVKELCELAEISKATFYLHYKDIYDLSDTLQQQVIKDILGHLNDPKDIIYHLQKANTQIIEGYYANQNIVHILFSGMQFAKLPECIETEIKKLVFEQFPELEHDAATNIRITYQMMGSFYSFYQYEKQFGHESVLKTVNEIARLFENMSSLR